MPRSLQRLRILIVDDHAVMGRGVRSLLETRALRDPQQDRSAEARSLKPVLE
jgi:DNA-binding NarL/FixJ family response regulator